MSLSPPAALVRMREADVVRLCGLRAAASGIDLASRHAVAHARREQGRIFAAVEDVGTHAVWVEPASQAAEAAHWQCDCDGAPGTADAPSDPLLACAHVAAVLTAWIRRPADFVVPDAPATSEPEHSSDSLAGERRPVAADRLTQPRLLRPPARQRGATTLASELAQLPAAELSALARRILNADLSDADARVALGGALRSSAVLDPLLARLEGSARDLLAGILLLGGSLTAADLAAIATRSERPTSALQADIAVLARQD
ncbi:MAG: hypothetical protein ACHQ4H_11795, partial [Ktedonobacterales bacterium]